MEYVDALYELKSPKRMGEELNNELDDFKTFVNDIDFKYQKFLDFITTRYDYKENQPVKRNKTLEMVKVEGQKACREGNKPSQKKYPQVILIDDDSDDDMDSDNKLCTLCNGFVLPDLKEPPERSKRSEAGGSNSVLKRSRPTQQDRNDSTKKPSKCKQNKTPELKVKVEAQKAGTSNPVSGRASTSQLGAKANKKPQLMKFLEAIRLEDDDQDSYSPSDEPGPKDKGKRVVSENEEVEILDDALFLKPGTMIPYVPSKRYHESLFDEDAENVAYRKDVLEVLRKPFNMEEYNKLKNHIEAGSFLDHFADLKEVLKSRRKLVKRLAILRGFFFWFKNSSRAGAFRPWNDRVCLEACAKHVLW